MRERVVATADPDGLPCAEISPSDMWELVEYISYPRATVIYRYHGSNFTVTFTHADMESAQRLLDEWVEVGSRELQPA